MLPATLPLVPALPICSVPALIVVVPVVGIGPRQRECAGARLGQVGRSGSAILDHS
jgi:hypothetical protein